METSRGAVRCGKTLYKDLEKARADRAVKETAKEAKQINTAGKRTHGLKRKTLEQAGMLEAETRIARISEARVEVDEIAPEPWRAPVMRTW